MRGTFPRQVSLLHLISEVEYRSLALPEFQREFEWQDQQVQALLTTLLKGWPAGSLLFLEASGSMFFRPRKFQGGPEVQKNFSGTIVLDGQQRLTSVFHALTGTGESVYGFKLPLREPLKVGVDDVEESIVSLSRRTWDKQTRTSSYVILDESLVVPFSALREVTGFYDWRDRAVKALGETYPDIGTRLRDAYKELFENLQTYSFPAIFVDSSVSPEAVARIFERVNRNSEPLSTFDLLVAKTFKPGWNMRDLWAETRLAWPRLDEYYGDNGVVVAETIGLLQPKPSVRRGDILNMPADDVRTNWNAAADAVGTVVESLAEHCGCLSPKNLSYGVLVPLYAALHLTQSSLVKRPELLRRHFYLSSFGLRFDVAANTRVVEDFNSLSAPIDPTSFLDEAASRRPVSLGNMEDATRTSHAAISKATVCLLIDRLAQNGQSTEGLIVVSLWPKIDGANFHLRASSLVVVDRHAARLVSGSGAWRLRQEPSLSSALRHEFIPWTDATDPAAVHAARTQLLATYLEAEFGAIIESDPERSQL